jgi:hypothetical protein
VSDNEEDELYCMPSPTNWIRETLRYGFSPSNKIVLKGSKTKTISSFYSGATSNPSGSEDNESLSHESSSQKYSESAGKGHMNEEPRRKPSSTTRDDISEFSGGGSILSSSTHSAASSTRIIAPHVNKLSLGSVVEVLLEGDCECVAVLCSVDVLKMRSQLFQTLLIRQEAEILTAPIPPANKLWRRSLVMEQEAPFEAAAFLESLHEGRTPREGEWSLAWANLR